MNKILKNLFLIVIFTSFTNLGVFASMDDLDQELKEQFPRFFPARL